MEYMREVKLRELSLAGVRVIKEREKADGGERQRRQGRERQKIRLRAGSDGARQDRACRWGR